MNFDLILLIILFSILRRNLHTKTLYPQWHSIFLGGIIVSAVLLLIETTAENTRELISGISHALFFVVIYLSLKRNEFKPVRAIVIAVLPLAAISFIQDVVILINP